MATYQHRGINKAVKRMGIYGILISGLTLFYLYFPILWTTARSITTANTYVVEPAEKLIYTLIPKDFFVFAAALAGIIIITILLILFARQLLKFIEKMLKVEV